jgi:hypothetical protein
MLQWSDGGIALEPATSVVPSTTRNWGRPIEKIQHRLPQIRVFVTSMIQSDLPLDILRQNHPWLLQFQWIEVMIVQFSQALE